jgi:hypothetical protein
MGLIMYDVIFAGQWSGFFRVRVRVRVRVRRTWNYVLFLLRSNSFMQIVIYRGGVPGYKYDVIFTRYWISPLMNSVMAPASA